MKNNKLKKQAEAIFSETNIAKFILDHLQNNTLPDFFEQHKNLLNIPLHNDRIFGPSDYPFDLILGYIHEKYTIDFPSPEKFNSLLSTFVPLIYKYELKLSHINILNSLVTSETPPQILIDFITALLKVNSINILQNRTFNNEESLLDYYKEFTEPEKQSPELIEYLEKIELEYKLKNNK